jgi:type IV pilus assembly protein PilV
MMKGLISSAHPAPVIHGREKGITLVEMLVTMVVVSFGLVSIAMLQMKSLQYSQTSFNRSLVTIQANDLNERMWAEACNLDTRLDAITEDWQGDHRDSMNGWEAELSESDGIYTATIHWTQGQIDADEAFQYTFSVPNMECE